MPFWTKPPKQTNEALPLVGVNKKITATEFNELTQLINDNFQLFVAPEDGQIYGRQDGDWVVVTGGGGGLTISEIITGIEAQTLEDRLDAGSLKNLQAAIDAAVGNTSWREDTSKWELLEENPFNLKIPTATEWEDEAATWNSNDSNGAFNSVLKLVQTGARNSSNGGLINNSNGSYWTSTVTSPTFARYYLFSSVASTLQIFPKATGAALRLIVDGTFTQQEYDDNYLNETVIINDLNYGFVYNSTTERIWLDRNLGSTQIATSVTDLQALGGLFQWGRNADGHEIRNPQTTNVQATTTTPDHGDFIIGNNNWLNPSNDNLWQGIFGINNPAVNKKLIGKNGEKASYLDLKDKPQVGGVTTFEALTDTFDFVGEALKFVRVDSSELALEPFDLFGSLNQWSNYNQFNNQLIVNQFLSLGDGDNVANGVFADNFPYEKSVLVLTQFGQTSGPTFNSIAPTLDANDLTNKNRILVFRNESTQGFNITINNEGTGLAQNRFYLNANLVIPPRESAIFIYRDETTGQDGWYLLSKSFGGGTTYTDAQARTAQALTASTGTAIAFDRPRKYNIETAAGTGNITFDFTNAIDGTTQVLRHNSGTKPTMPASANKLSGDYVVSVDNQIYLTVIRTSATPTWRVDVTVSQNNTW